MKIIPVILSGGTGTRLWPLSRESHPKPFITLPDGETLLQKAFIRAAMAISQQTTTPLEILTITNKDYYLKTKAEYEKTAVAATISSRFLLEPHARNTAPAILLAALDIAKRHGPETLLLVLPADHLINDLATFQTACEAAYALAAQQYLVTFGITPTRAETGFGYIELGSALDQLSYQAKRFVEKPDKVTAEHYLTSKQYLWNSGMFCFSAQTILSAFQEYAPEMLAMANTLQRIHPHSDHHVTEFSTADFNQLESISIDYAIMEKAQNIAVVRGDFAWHDIGSWEAYKNLFAADPQGNTIFGDAILIDSQNNLIHSENRMVASIGIQNLTIIDTPDALLITQRERGQEVKEIVHTLKQRAHESYLTHRTVIRPWGSYTVLEEGSGYKIKRIVVKPQGTLSLQLHKFRSEHWVVIAGTAKVIHGKREYLLQINESTFIPMNTPHRLSNPTDSDLVIIEVQTGSYVGEDDIIRLEDTYGRVAKHTTTTEESIA